MAAKYRNTTLRLSNVGWYPYVFTVNQPDGTFRLKGITGSMIDYILASMGIKYQLVDPSDHKWGNLEPDGSWSGMIGQINRNEADLALGPFVLTEREAMVANPSPPYTDEDMIILSGVAKEHKSNVYGYISAFDLHVWMVLLCFLGFVATVAVVAEYLLSNPEMSIRQRRQRLTRIFWTFVASVFLESSTFNFTSHSQRLLFGFWFLMIVVLMNTFVSYMESALMLKEETDRVETIEQLALHPDIQPMVFEAAGFLQVIREAEGQAFQKVLRMMEEYDHEEEVHGEELFTPPYLSMVLKRKAVFLMERISLLARVSQHCYDVELKGQGLFHLGRKRILQIKMVFYVRKTMDPVLQASATPPQEEIFKRVRWIMDSGLNLHWHEDLIPDPGPCWTKFHPDHLHDYASLNYQDFAVIFYLLLCSHGLAFCGYLSELVLFHWCCLKSRSRIGPNSYLN
ncbi:glutamate receptor U1, putative [Ixodes scapularis]|uniref:Glutamate receptor U1, putative n=1 Tax=Ixodes scapularis TaxID=6945 RepID=B7QD50_IXOSC|nr:glutamate receptor U1, putative [Ixodes scapularis]|eukprot:XP_002413464.1 glutamate receptor U1, putative [Ixodes scapularis]